MTFAWNTASVAKGTYTISAVADAFPSETDTSDNTSTDGGVLVTWLGDVNGDYRIDEDDLWYFCGAFIDYWKAQ